MPLSLKIISDGEKAFSRERWGEAERLFTKALKSNRDLFLRAEILYRRAESRRSQSKFILALADYWASHQYYRKLNIPSERLRTVLGASQCLRILSRYPDARRLWVSVAKQSFYNAPDPSPADVRLERALVARGEGHWADARSYLAEAKKLINEKDLSSRQHLYWVEGGVERFSGHPREARVAFQKATALAREMGDGRALAYALCGWAGVDRVLGYEKGSFENYQKAYAEFQKDKDLFGQAYGLCGQANALRTFGDASLSLSLYRRSAGLYNRLGDASSEGFAWWGLGGSFRRLGQWTKSRNAYVQATALFKKSKDDRGLVMALLGEARLADDLKKVSLSKAKRTTARSLARSKKLPYEMALCDHESGVSSSPLASFGISSDVLSRWKDIP